MSANISFWISLSLTLVIFSYLLADNVLYRIAVSVFIGLAAAFTTIVTVQSIFLPLLIGEQTNFTVFLVAVILGLLLLLKPFGAMRLISNIAFGMLIAVGTAAAIVGAISGTIIPFISQTTQLNVDDGIWTLVSGIILIVGVVSSLLYFNYSARVRADGTIERGRIMQGIAAIGRGFIIVTLGALYGAAILTSLSILTGQLNWLFGT